MQFWKIIRYILCTSIVVFILGRVFPRKLIFEDRFPFKSFGFEKGGRIYNKIGIMKWKTQLPDASVTITKILPKFMPRKRIDQGDQIPILIKETCIAEATHVLVAILGFGCVFIWNGIGGWIVSIVFLLFNIPFIIIQRFNRPRLIRANMMMSRPLHIKDLV